MKPWLLNVLACPLDKHHPLEAYFFKWETSEEELEKIARETGKPNKYFAKGYRHLASQILDGTISPPSIRAIRDLTGSENSLELGAEALNFLGRLEEGDFPSAQALLSAHPEGVDSLYRYLNLVEVEAGLLRCPRCGRWYPIGCSVGSVPELLPDELRKEEEELAWLERWASKVPRVVLEEGRPFKPK